MWISRRALKRKKYLFRDIHNFSFSAKIQKWRKLNFSPLHRILLYYPVGKEVLSKSLYLVQFSRYSHFFIFCKNPRWPPKVVKIEIFPLCVGYYPAGQKFAGNHSILYGFRHIHTFSFSAKIQDGRQK